MVVGAPPASIDTSLITEGTINVKSSAFAFFAILLEQISTWDHRVERQQKQKHTHTDTRLPKIAPNPRLLQVLY